MRTRTIADDAAALAHVPVLYHVPGPAGPGRARAPFPGPSHVPSRAHAPSRAAAAAAAADRYLCFLPRRKNTKQHTRIMSQSGPITRAESESAASAFNGFWRALSDGIAYLQ